MGTKIETITLDGALGLSLEFNIYSLDSKLKPISCVYTITRLHKDSNGDFKHEIIYIGQTDDISTRLNTHHKRKCFNNNYANCIGIYQENEEERREYIETALIKIYDPICND